MEDVLPFIVASLMIILVITLSIRMQVSTFENLDEVSVENKERLSYKASGSFRILNQGQEYGILSKTRFLSEIENCGQINIGFSGEPLSLEEAGCEMVEKPLPVPVKILNNSYNPELSQIYNIRPYNELENQDREVEKIITQIHVGEGSERFN